jgi:hypothetical protein
MWRGRIQLGWRLLFFLFERRKKMFVKEITYTDFNGNERKEKFYFNLTRAEVAKLEMSTTGGLAEQIQRIIDAQDQPSLIQVFEDIIQKSYGVKTPDGRGFLKRPEDLESFMATEAYSILFMELATDDKAGAEFINGIVPANMSQPGAQN